MSEQQNSGQEIIIFEAFRAIEEQQAVIRDLEKKMSYFLVELPPIPSVQKNLRML